MGGVVTCDNMPKTPILINSIRLKNFKAFQDTGILPLKRITPLVGKNSAGKFLISKSIFLLSQTSDKQAQMTHISVLLATTLTPHIVV